MPNGILGILGISTGTYAVSKGIQTAGNTKAKELDIQAVGAASTTTRVAAVEVWYKCPRLKDLHSKMGTRSATQKSCTTVLQVEIA